MTSWTIALAALRKNALQTGLTILGMTIGVATVLTMISIGTGAQHAIRDQVVSAGMNLLLVNSGNFDTKVDLEAASDAGGTPVALDLHRSVSPPLLRVQADGVAPDPNDDARHRRGYQRPGDLVAGRGAAHTLTLDDAETLRHLRGVQFVSPGIHQKVSVTAGDQTHFTSLHGDDVDQPRIRRVWTFPFGRFFTPSEQRNADHVVVLGEFAAERLFGLANPVGKTVTMKGQPFRVVGVITSGSWIVTPTESDDQFDAVYIPVTTMQTLVRQDYLSTIALTTSSTGDVTRVRKAVLAVLRARHHIDVWSPDDFTVSTEAHKALSKGLKPDVAAVVTGNVPNLEKVTLDELGKTLEQASSTMSALLVCTAAVSLLVGGIGVMNVMLLSVSQRTREIGIRRAVGARAPDILAQFLLEAIALSTLGGLLGILLGCAVALWITQSAHWSTEISAPAVLFSFGISATIGIFFGYYPARQAARLTPVDALGAE
jgi:putative ABC transport system permease protein